MCHKNKKETIMKLHDLVKLFGELVFLITSIALAHILIVKVLMHGGEVGVGVAITIIAGLAASKLAGK